MHTDVCQSRLPASPGLCLVPERGQTKTRPVCWALAASAVLGTRGSCPRGSRSQRDPWLCSVVPHGPLFPRFIRWLCNPCDRDSVLGRRFPRLSHVFILSCCSVVGLMPSYPGIKETALSYSTSRAFLGPPGVHLLIKSAPAGKAFRSCSLSLSILELLSTFSSSPSCPLWDEEEEEECPVLCVALSTSEDGFTS